MPEPLYLTDAERPLRPPAVRERYRFYVVFRIRANQYTRWFADPETGKAYVANAPGTVLLSAGTERTLDDENARLREVNP